jgi:hypothetical protein
MGARQKPAAHLASDPVAEACRTLLKALKSGEVDAQRAFLFREVATELIPFLTGELVAGRGGAETVVNAAYSLTNCLNWIVLNDDFPETVAQLRLLAGYATQWPILTGPTDAKLVKKIGEKLGVGGLSAIKSNLGKASHATPLIRFLNVLVTDLGAL